MKINFSHIALAKLCGWFGVTRQAYYQNQKSQLVENIQHDLILNVVKEIRVLHPKIGTRKLYKMLIGCLNDHGIKMGRDALFDLLAGNQLLVRKRRRNIRTTFSNHRFRKYPNLIKEFIATAPNQLWVSDITYWRINQNYVYISFVTDVYSHKIVGYQVASSMEAIESVKALLMALSELDPASLLNLIHHSDRGIQYCSNIYVKQLQDYGIKISMTENGDPRENSVAERINGIIKNEYLETYKIDNLKDAKKLLKAVVELYNNERPHMSIGNLTPNQIHQSKENITTKKLWKNYYQKSTTIVNPIQD